MCRLVEEDSRNPISPQERQIQTLELCQHREDLERQIRELEQAQNKRSYTCYILVTFFFTAFCPSLALALWWSTVHGDVSGGFTLGAYIIAAAALPSGIMS